MNERIRELAEQCYQIEDPHGQFPREVFDQEKFAELLIKECALMAFHNVVNLSSIADAEDVEANIREHFGVES